jgi:SAM-dependent methyltransferase
MTTDELWERHAGWWQREFTNGADPEYTEQIIPLAVDLLAGFERVLDIGTGEGQIARILQARGAAVIGIDVAAAQIAEARKRGRGPCFLRGAAHGLPFDDESFDAAIACLVFEHIDELDAAIAEAARVLRPGGRFALFLNHPLLQTPNSGWIDDHILDPPEQYWRIGAYLVEAETIEQVQNDVFIRFVHRPLHRYVNGMADVGLAVVRMLEPPPPSGFLDNAREYHEAATVPRLMVLVAEKSV